MNILPSSPTPDLEPDGQWKASLRNVISANIQSMVRDATESREERLKITMTEEQRSRIIQDYTDTLNSIRRLADEQYAIALERERAERRWAANTPVGPEWTRILAQEQQIIMDNIQKDDGRVKKVYANASNAHEPDEEWKTNLENTIQAGMQSKISDAKESRDERLKTTIAEKERSRIARDYLETVADIRKLAEEQYASTLELERVERRLAAIAPVHPNWKRTLAQGQQIIVDNIQKDEGQTDKTHSMASNVVRDSDDVLRAERHSPASLAELADRAKNNDWDPHLGLKHWLKVAEKHRETGKRFISSGDLEDGFVELTTAATLVLEKIPTHPDYSTLLNPSLRGNLQENGQDMLDRLAKLKPLLLDRYHRWMGQHPEEVDSLPKNTKEERIYSGEEECERPALIPPPIAPSHFEVWRPHNSNQDTAYSTTASLASSGNENMEELTYAELEKQLREVTKREEEITRCEQELDLMEAQVRAKEKEVRARIAKRQEAQERIKTREELCRKLKELKDKEAKRRETQMA